MVNIEKETKQEMIRLDLRVSMLLSPEGCLGDRKAGGLIVNCLEREP
jgi:hypothetical protein